AVKSSAELQQLRIASEGVIDSMLAVIAKHGPGASKRELTEALRREETSRGLIFDYCLITAGSSLNRPPSEQKWEKGDILSLESGMVVSVETTLQHPQRGFIKLEDTVVVTDKGFDIYGEGGRGWNRGGTRLSK